jgi:hypothetical protein
MDAAPNSWRVALLWGGLLTVVAFFLRVGTSFLRGEPSGFRDRTNYIGTLLSGILLGLLVEFDHLIPHAQAVVLILSLVILCVVVFARYRSQSF